MVMRMRWSFLLVGLLLFTTPLFAEPPTGKARIGVLSAVTAEEDAVCLDPLRRGLGALGYLEGRNYELELRNAGGRAELLPSLAVELVQRRVDLILVISGTAVEAATKATTSIPVVMASSFYAVEMGFIAGLAHPGGNVTGETHFTPELMAKRVQLLKETVSTISRIAVLRLPGHIHDLVIGDMTAAGSQLGVQLQTFEVERPEDLGPAFDAAARAGAQAVMSTQSPFFRINRVKIAQLALQHRLPSLSGEPNSAQDGALLFYGPNVLEGCERVVKYVDRVVNGTKPADLPVEQPTKIRFVINLKTAQMLGLTIPREILARADEVIE